MRRWPVFLLAWLMLGGAVSLYAKEVLQPTQGQEQQLKVASAPSPKAIEAMHLAQSKDAYQRELGFLRLEALREPATIEFITGYLNRNEPDLRAYSLRALSAIQGPAAAPTLLAALQHDRQARVRRAALLGLEPLVPSDPAILPGLMKALRDRSTEVRMAAIDVVSRIDDPRAREAILIRNKRENQKDVRRVLELAMKRLKVS